MVKRGYEVLSSKIDRVEKEIEDTANLSFEFRCFSGLSLMMFLYCCTLLFIAPFYSDWFLLLFTAFVLCHSLMGCYKGDIILVCNLMWVIFEFIIILVLSLVAYSFSIRYNWVGFCDIFKNILILTSALLPMLNFIVFFVKSLYKMEGIKKKIEISAKDIENDVNETHRNFDLLQSLEQLKMDI
jgi:hypothetical protein